MPAKFLAALFLALFPLVASAAWQMVATEQGRRIEIDRESIHPGENASLNAKGRIVFDKPINDPKTSIPYRIIEIESRYDCAQRASATLKRFYFKDDGSLLRQDDVGPPIDMLVRSGTPDDRLLREVCRPVNNTDPANAPRTLTNKIDQASVDLRKSNAALIERAIHKERITGKPPALAPGHRAPAPARPAARVEPSVRRAWSYEGSTGPEYWGTLNPDYPLCASGHRQSPIDLRDGFALDLDTIQFRYLPVPFRVINAGMYLQMSVFGGSIELSGKNYRLTHLVFHTPSEFLVSGKRFDMEVQLFHRTENGKQAVVSILLDADGQSGEHPIIQAALNDLPLEKGVEELPPRRAIDLNALLPTERGYFTFMGSLTTPPCSEDVLWLILKQPQSLSLEQLAMFQRLYRPNARPIQPVFGRIIKESR